MNFTLNKAMKRYGLFVCLFFILIVSVNAGLLDFITGKQTYTNKNPLFLLYTNKDTYSPEDTIQVYFKIKDPDGTPGTPDEGWSVKLFVIEGSLVKVSGPMHYNSKLGEWEFSVPAKEFSISPLKLIADFIQKNQSVLVTGGRTTARVIIKGTEIKDYTDVYLLRNGDFTYVLPGGIKVQLLGLSEDTATFKVGEVVGTVLTSFGPKVIGGVSIKLIQTIPDPTPTYAFFQARYIGEKCTIERKLTESEIRCIDNVILSNGEKFYKMVKEHCDVDNFVSDYPQCTEEELAYISAKCIMNSFPPTKTEILRCLGEISCPISGKLTATARECVDKVVSKHNLEEEVSKICDADIFARQPDYSGCTEEELGYLSVICAEKNFPELKVELETCLSGKVEEPIVEKPEEINISSCGDGVCTPFVDIVDGKNLCPEDCPKDKYIILFDGESAIIRHNNLVTSVQFIKPLESGVALIKIDDKPAGDVMVNYPFGVLPGLKMRIVGLHTDWGNIENSYIILKKEELEETPIIQNITLPSTIRISSVWADKSLVEPDDWITIYAKVVDDDGTPATPQEGTVVGFYLNVGKNLTDVKYMNYDPDTGYYSYSLIVDFKVSPIQVIVTAKKGGLEDKNSAFYFEVVGGETVIPQPVEVPTVTITPELLESLRQRCDGCMLEDACVPFGTRIKGKYCDLTKRFVPQKELGEVCENDYECKSNECSDGKCISTYGLLQKILSWLKSLFRFGK